MSQRTLYYSVGVLIGIGILVIIYMQMRTQIPVPIKAATNDNASNSASTALSMSSTTTQKLSASTSVQEPVSQGNTNLPISSAPGAEFPREPLISFSFDDGWQTAYLNALPILRNDGYQAKFYIISTRVGTP